MPTIHMTGAEFLTPLTKGFAEPSTSKSLGKTMERSANQSRNATQAVPFFEDWRQAAHDIKQYAIANLDKILVEFERNVAARGATVLWAKDAAEANQHVLDVAKQHNVKSVVKSKSMVSEEMELDHVLEAAGIRAVETDFGEFIVQVAHQRPVHIVGPALHMSAADVGRLFEEKLGEPFTEDHTKLCDIARRRLREEYLQADMGMSGCNFAVADTGTVVIIENEGNAGLSTATPPVHVVLVGIEKMLPKLDYLPLFLNMLGRCGTGQKLTSYTHLIGGPAPGKKLYVIILDNGRSNVLKDPAGRESLYCIRCGLCLNNCPVYRRAGGWAYGWVYPGPIGSVLTPQLLGLEKAGKLPFASSLCGLCRRGLPRENRHPASTRPPAPPCRERALADELARAANDLDGLGMVHGRADSLQAGHDAGADLHAAAEVPPLASEHVGGVDPRPRTAEIAQARFPKLVEEEQGPIRTVRKTMTVTKKQQSEEKEAFSAALAAFVRGLTEYVSADDGQWTVKGFIDVFKSVYTISSDTKIISKILEIHLFPQILRFAEETGFSIVLAEHQNWYPDLSFVKTDNPSVKFAVDIKTTYRDPDFPGHVNGFTLGSHGAYFKNRTSTKNIQFPYANYSGHFCLGIIYTRNDGKDLDETQVIHVVESTKASRPRPRAATD